MVIAYITLHTTCWCSSSAVQRTDTLQTHPAHNVQLIQKPSIVYSLVTMNASYYISIYMILMSPNNETTTPGRPTVDSGQVSHHINGACSCRAGRRGIKLLRKASRPRERTRSRRRGRKSLATPMAVVISYSTSIRQDDSPLDVARTTVSRARYVHQCECAVKWPQSKRCLLPVDGLSALDPAVAHCGPRTTYSWLIEANDVGLAHRGTRCRLGSFRFTT